ncbi:MAG TPA: murein biosynthesis integral membrane protein MurJ [Terriglobales bacterium]|jgi:putative peptidoglycan lipid II flippase|nr:murein biosynthesis integral membrane protein MurJ [Terriglobales bacterium]
MADFIPDTETDKVTAARRWLRLIQPSHQHTAFSATILLMVAMVLSRIVGYVREAYTAWAFGAGSTTDAYIAAFQIPDFLAYLVAGGTISITFVSIYTRFLAEKREQDAQKTFSVIITVMTVVLGIGVVLTEIFAPQITRLMFHNFKPAQLDLCVHLTRVLLPAQIFFYVGGIVAAVLSSRRLFLFPALGPLIYNGFIILGGVTLSRTLGIAALAYGALIGTFVGPFLINAIGAARVGTGFSISFDVRNPAFREWVRMSIPLMVGVSLVSADDWILRYFASDAAGAISHINYAKRLLQVPIAILGQAVGQASLPFFARLFGEKRFGEFASTVNGSVYRTAAAALLASSLMMAAALPLIDLVYRLPHGHFVFADSQATATFFFWFSLSLVFWAAQGLYARAFYAAGNTLTPMVASSLITVASLPMYRALYHALSAVGLALASDVGIAANCLAMAILVHQRKLVPWTELQWKELGKATITAVVAGVLSYRVASAVMVSGSRIADIEALALIGITWAGAVAAGLWLTQSQLPGDLRRRKAPVLPQAAEKQVEELTKGIVP